MLVVTAVVLKIVLEDRAMIQNSMVKISFLAMVALQIVLIKL